MDSFHNWNQLWLDGSFSSQPSLTETETSEDIWAIFVRFFPVTTFWILQHTLSQTPLPRPSHYQNPPFLSEDSHHTAVMDEDNVQRLRLSGTYLKMWQNWFKGEVWQEHLTEPHHHTTVLRPFFRDHPGEPVPEEDFWTLWCKGRLTEADTLTIRLGATPSGLTSAIPPYFLQAGCPSCCPTNSVKALKACV